MKKKMIPVEERETTTISLQIPCDIIDDLKFISEARGITNLQSLIKFYVGQGLRKDIAELKRKNSAKEIMDKYKSRKIRNDSEREIQEGKGIGHEDFRKELETETQP